MDEIKLLDGRMLPVSDIEMRDNWDFYRMSSGERLTYKIKQSDKVYSFPTFDKIKSNDEIYKETSGDKSDKKETNVTKLFAKQILTDPLAAPADFAAAGVAKLKSVVSSPITWAIVLAVGIGVVIYYIPRSKP